MLERVVPTYRLTDYQDNGDLLADTVNKDFDRLWMAIQRSFIYLGLAFAPLLGGHSMLKVTVLPIWRPVNAQDAATKTMSIMSVWSALGFLRQCRNSATRRSASKQTAGV
jgi:hypothetical protein